MPDERLYLNADRTLICRHGDPAAAFLLSAAGQAIPDEYADLPHSKWGEAPKPRKKPPSTKATKQASDK